MIAFKATSVKTPKKEIIETIYDVILEFERGLSTIQREYLDAHFPSRVLLKEAVDIGFLKGSFKHQLRLWEA